jgi:hypothetical protein
VLPAGLLVLQAFELQELVQLRYLCRGSLRWQVASQVFQQELMVRRSHWFVQAQELCDQLKNTLPLQLRPMQRQQSQLLMCLSSLAQVSLQERDHALVRQLFYLSFCVSVSFSMRVKASTKAHILLYMRRCSGGITRLRQKSSQVPAYGSSQFGGMLRARIRNGVRDHSVRLNR